MRFMIMGLAFAGLAAGCASDLQRSSVAAPTVIAGSLLGPGLPDGNTIIFEDAVGLTIIDTGRHHEHQQQILNLARTRGKPITHIINTHWHLDHTGGNAELRAVYPDASIYTTRAIENALEVQLARSLANGEANLARSDVTEDRKAEIRLSVEAIRDRRNLLPDVAVERPMTLALSNRTLELNITDHAVSESDVWIYDPATRTAVVGDLVVIPVPLFESACPEGWRAALEEISRTPFETLIPGHGDPMSRIEFETYRRAFAGLVDCGRGQADKQVCADGWARDVDTLLRDQENRDAARENAAYYVEEYIRSDERRQAFCGARGA